MKDCVHCKSETIPNENVCAGCFIKELEGQRKDPFSDRWFERPYMWIPASSTFINSRECQSRGAR